MRPLGAKDTAAWRLRPRGESALRSQIPAVAVSTVCPRNCPGVGSCPTAVTVSTFFAARVALEGTSTVTVIGVEALGAIWPVSVGVIVAAQSCASSDTAKVLFCPLLLIKLAVYVM